MTPDLRLERGQQTRAKLVQAARTLFGTNGYEHTSTEQVLKEAGVTKGSMYHHFANKAELFDAVLEELMRDAARHIAAQARKARTPLNQLKRGCAAWLELAADPHVQRIAVLDPVTVVGYQRWRELDERYVLGGVRASLRAMETIPQDQVDLVAQMVLAGVNEAALTLARTNDLASAKRGVDLLLTRLAAPG